MRRAAIAALVLVFIVFVGCDRGDEETSPVPHLYEDGLSILPNPAPAYSEVTVFFPFYDHDGDVKNASVFVRLETETGDEIELAPEEGTFEVLGDTNGAMSFDLKLGSQSESQGTYYIYIVDEAGHRSNEISEYLLVNPPEGEE